MSDDVRPLVLGSSRRKEAHFNSGRKRETAGGRWSLLTSAATTITIALGAILAPSSPAQPAFTAAQLNQMWSQGRAEGKGQVKLKTFPLRVENISHINPMGMMASGHTTPNDQLYLVATTP